MREEQSTGLQQTRPPETTSSLPYLEYLTLTYSTVPVLRSSTEVDRAALGRVRRIPLDAVSEVKYEVRILRTLKPLC